MASEQIERAKAAARCPGPAPGMPCSESQCEHNDGGRCRPRSARPAAKPDPQNDPVACRFTQCPSHERGRCLYRFYPRLCRFAEQYKRDEQAAAAAALGDGLRNVIPQDKTAETATATRYAASVEQLCREEQRRAETWAQRAAAARRLNLTCTSPEEGKACPVPRCPALMSGRCRPQLAIDAARQYADEGWGGR